MLHPALSDPSAPSLPVHVLMTVDSVGGVWRYAVDAARGLNGLGIAVTLAGLGPRPSARRAGELDALPATRLVWIDEPLDWMVGGEQALERLPAVLADLVRESGADLLHLNVPSQAAGLAVPCPVVVVAHSCVATWWAAVRGDALPDGWGWQIERTRRGLLAADAALAPSRAHAAAVTAVYGPVPALAVLENAAGPGAGRASKEPFVVAAGRWWDEGKNGRVLDAAAGLSRWPVRMAGALEGPNGERLALRHAEALGERPSADVIGLMARAAVAASPSRYEPFGLSVLEAAHAGCALVLSDIPTYRELWEGAALFAPPDDPAAHADALDRLAGDDDLRAALSRRARRAAARFSPDRQAAGLSALYARLLAEAGRGVRPALVAAQ